MNISSLSSVLCRQVFKHHRATQLCVIGVRNLYTPSALGIDRYQQMRERIRMQFNEMGDRFRTKMKEYVAPNSTYMVFTEDLKHMIHLIDPTEEDLELVEQMIIKFSQQNKNLRFGSYIFGPVIMRMYYNLNKPKEALRVFLNPDLEEMFTQIISFQLLMDLLYNNEMYDEVMQVANVVRDKQLPNSRYPRNVVVLAMAAAYKKNTPESLQFMKELWAGLNEAGHEPMRRAITFAAALSINQGEPHIALELLSQVPTQNYVTVRNLKVSALADVNRPDDTLPILRSVLEIESPNGAKHTFCTEVLDKVKAAVDKCDKKDVQQEFQRIHNQLTQLDYVSDIRLDSVLTTDIDKVLVPQRRDQRILSAKFDGTDRRRDNPNFSFRNQRRPSLQDME